MISYLEWLGIHVILGVIPYSVDRIGSKYKAAMVCRVEGQNPSPKLICLELGFLTSTQTT